MRNIDEVIERMRAIDRELSAGDGVGCFNRMYLRVTENVAAALASGRFEDGAFIGHLDVVFADLFFVAYDAVQAGQAPPRCWQPLFAARARPHILPIQFALAGMNAHINHDLALALVRSCADFGAQLAEDTARHRDYLLVNQILEETEAAVKSELSQGLIRALDEVMAPGDDVMAMWSVRRARDTAWTQARAMMVLGETPLGATYLTALDRLVGFAGRALLLPRMS